MTILKYSIFIFSIILLMGSCAQNSVEENNAAARAEAPVVKNINDVAINLPVAAGEDEFKGNCMICHSLRFIQMQPAFPQKTWEKIVDKMVKNFGAPIPDSTAKVIVNYLVAVKGKK